ncbi:M56 family metallopeptidase [archaeon]|nr:M56 family metallopeptidase [archaeon]
MTLNISREREIEQSVEDSISYHDGNIEDYRLQDHLSRMGIYKIFSDKYSPRKGILKYFSDKLIMILKEGIDNLEEVIAHEIGHVELGHMISRQQIAQLSPYALWERVHVKKEKYPEGDTPQEKVEADYFSRKWCEKLDGIKWLDRLEVISLSQYSPKE